MTHPDSPSDASSSTPANREGAPAPVTRRRLRDERAAAELLAQAGAAGGEPVSQAQSPAPDARPLTRRELREQQLRRELELRAEEIATLEIAPLDSAALEPQLELPLIEAEPASDPLAPPPPLQVLPSRRTLRAAPAPDTVGEAVVEVEAGATVSPSLATETETVASRRDAGTDSAAAGGRRARRAPQAPTGAERTVAEHEVPPRAEAEAEVIRADLAAAAGFSIGLSPAVAPSTQAAAAIAPPSAPAAIASTSAPASSATDVVVDSRASAADVVVRDATAVPSRRSRTSVRRSPARRGWRGLVARGPASTGPDSARGSAENGGKGGTRRGWAKAGVSAVAMAFVLGITAVTALPSTVSASPMDSNLVNLSLTANAGGDTQQLITSDAAASTAIDRDGYAVADVGELQAAGYSTAQLLVGRSLAQELVNAMDAGKLVGSQPDHMKEIRWIAEGVTVPDCGVDYRILEIIAIAVRNFDQVGVSDINRKCTGQLEGAGTSSSHYIDGGGHAVDFYLLDNKSLNGYDSGTLKLISLLDPVMPVGSRVGQAGCRASAGVSVQLTNWTEFDDSCTHMHVDVPVTDAPLLLADSSLLSSQ
ncbi:hypothetical protein N1031_10520 [Herbiconiux moechotypicola]|uniref:Extensin-like C-terminal domain-containing protein n=1 Tax=Herbiconiux moechotypicola TaxID=637393 RepID=A0ABN3DM93_9MICO|nr:hypothetical protein [Herbiconiux moechotypicola]MCS5730196.1 hypothetical protein [Herbiconiux moechotypicola]